MCVALNVEYLASRTLQGVHFRTCNVMGKKCMYFFCIETYGNLCKKSTCTFCPSRYKCEASERHTAPHLIFICILCRTVCSDGRSCRNKVLSGLGRPLQFEIRNVLTLCRPMCTLPISVRGAPSTTPKKFIAFFLADPFLPIKINYKVGYQIRGEPLASICSFVKKNISVDEAKAIILNGRIPFERLTLRAPFLFDIPLRDMEEGPHEAAEWLRNSKKSASFP